MHTCSKEFTLKPLCLFYKSSGYPLVLLRNSQMCSVFHLHFSQSTVNLWYINQAMGILLFIDNCSSRFLNKNTIIQLHICLSKFFQPLVQICSFCKLCVADFTLYELLVRSPVSYVQLTSLCVSGQNLSHFMCCSEVWRILFKFYVSASDLMYI